MGKLIGNLKQGLLFVISAPAGTGKTTLVSRIVEEFSCVIRSISYTTRKPRKGEKEGIDYHYVSHKKFEEMIEQEEFLEYAKIYEEYYGTSKSWVEQELQKGKHVVLVIDTQGAMQIKEKVEATTIFLKPPSVEELKNRLEKRGADSQAAIQERLSWADRELAESVNYDYCVTNDALDTAYKVLKSILIAEEHRVCHQI